MITSHRRWYDVILSFCAHWEYFYMCVYRITQCLCLLGVFFFAYVVFLFCCCCFFFSFSFFFFFFFYFALHPVALCVLLVGRPCHLVHFLTFRFNCFSAVNWRKIYEMLPVLLAGCPFFFLFFFFFFFFVLYRDTVNNLLSYVNVKEICQRAIRLKFLI